MPLTPWSKAQSNLQQKPDESDEEFAQRKALVASQIGQLKVLINDLDQITIGWAIDRPAKKTYLDFTLTAQPGSKSAAQFNQAGDLKTQFAGFQRSDAMASISMTGKAAPEDAASTTEMIATLRERMSKEIDKSNDFPDEARKAKVKELLGGLIDVVADTAKSGTIDAGMAVVGKGPVTFALGAHVADSAKAEKLALEAVNLAKSEGDISDLRLNEAAHGDVHFHSFAPNVPPNAEGAEKLIGPNPRVVMGFGKQSVYLAFGANGVKVLQEAITASEKNAGQPAMPFQLTISLGPILKLAADAQPGNPILGMVASSLEESGQDKIRITSQPIPNGSRGRLEAEEGVLRLIGSAAAMASGGAGGGF